MNSIEGKANGKRSHGRSVTMELSIAALAAVLLAFLAATQFETGTGTVSLIAYMVPFSPNPVMVNDSASSTLTAEIGSDYNPPVPSGDENEGALTYMYDWSVSQIQYKALAADQFGSPPSNSYTDSISPSQPSTGSSAGLEFTPKIAGYWSVSTSCTVTVTDTKNNEKWSGSANCGPDNLTSYTLDITYTGPVVGQTNPDSGTVVTNGQINVHAGWPIQLGAVLAPSDLAGQFTWSIDGAGDNGSAAINGFIIATDISSAEVFTLVPANDTTSTFPQQYPLALNPVLFHYYYTKAGTFTASVQLQGASNPAKTKFDVAAPDGTKIGFSATYESPTIQTNLKGGAAEISLGPGPVGTGILFQHLPVHSKTFLGRSAFMQVYTENDLWVGLNGVQNFSASGSGVDYPTGTAFPYPTLGTLQNGDEYTDDAPSRYTDLFSDQVNYSPLSVDDSPEMWLMFMPAATGSIYIPLDSAPWSWGGTENYNLAAKAWTLAGQMPAAAGPVPKSGATDEYPTWTQRLQPPSPPK